MPASFIASISRGASSLETAGPNHHQRIIMRESSGGLTKDSQSDPPAGGAASPKGDLDSPASTESPGGVSKVFHTNSLREYRSFITLRPIRGCPNASPGMLERLCVHLLRSFQLESRAALLLASTSTQALSPGHENTPAVCSVQAGRSKTAFR